MSHSDIIISEKKLKEVWDLLDSLQAGQMIIIIEHAPNRPRMFIECCERYIDKYKRGEFNSTYTKFKQTLTYQETINTFKTYEKSE